MALLLAVPGWVSNAQQRGATLGSVQNSTSWSGPLWTEPLSTDSFDGLGNAITWAWDPALCDKLMPHFRENFLMINFISCKQLRAHAERALGTWAMNHKKLSFKDVTYQCERIGEPVANCSLAEIVITDLAPNAMVDPSKTAVHSTAHTRITSAFRSTNGRQGRVSLFDAAKGHSWDYDVPETYSAQLGVSNDVCWYSDSSFCAGFHSWKRSSDSPGSLFRLMVTILFSVWGVAMVLILYRLSRALRKQLSMSIKIDKDGDGVEAHEILAMLGQRGEAFLEVMSKQSLIGTASRLLCALIPWSFYSGIFVTCWNCYDFEAAIAHEAGHLLGLGYPDGAHAQNSYHASMAGGVPLNASNCLAPWAEVRLGVPAGAAVRNDGVSRSGVRPSIMERFTQHSPRICLTPDDVEGLNVLYPTCHDASIEPVCIKTDTNVGNLRTCIYVMLPAFFALFMAILLHNSIDRHLRRRQMSDKAKVLIMSKLLERQRARAKRDTNTALGPIHRKRGRWGRAARSTIPAPSSTWGLLQDEEKGHGETNAEA